MPFDGRAAGLQLRELIRALFGFPEDPPVGAVGATVEVTVADPKPQEQDQNG